jgi:hypothetical protein
MKTFPKNLVVTFSDLSSITPLQAQAEDERAINIPVVRTGTAFQWIWQVVRKLKWSMDKTLWSIASPNDTRRSTK